MFSHNIDLSIFEIHNTTLTISCIVIGLIIILVSTFFKQPKTSLNNKNMLEVEKLTWVYHNPLFEFDNPNIRIVSTWRGHLNFAYDLIRFMKPKQVVELGSFYGASFFGFCQAVKDGGLSTKCVAIDTWLGDPHTGFYKENVFETFKTTLNTFYPNNTQMIRSTFDDALNRFQDGTIDILHIDGYHTYEAVIHDFETWLPKVAKNGIILFHDIAVKDNNFGVYKLWDTLQKQYPSIEFEHSYGLGVLFPKGYSDVFNEVFQRVEELQQTYKV